jgi:hypothetical protein
MPFTPVSLPIQEILLTNFVTDIATISNANDLLLQAKLEDLINNLEIDITNLTIGTDNAIKSVKAQTVILQDLGFIFQTGTPNNIIATLEKNGLNESVFTVDILNVGAVSSINELTVQNLIVENAASFDAPVDFVQPVTHLSSVTESKETVTLDLTRNGADAEAVLNLTQTSHQNIFVKLKATTAPTLNPVYDGAGNIVAGVTSIKLYVDFDVTTPPAQNTTYTIYIVDVVEEFTQTSILSAVNGASLPLYVNGGTNQNTSTSIILHDGSANVGVNPASAIIANASVAEYGNNLSLTYIIDQNTDDRLIVTSMVGMELF